MKFDESKNSVSCMPSSPYKPLVEHRGGWTVSRAPIRKYSIDSNLGLL